MKKKIRKRATEIDVSTDVLKKQKEILEEKHEVEINGLKERLSMLEDYISRVDTKMDPSFNPNAKEFTLPPETVEKMIKSGKLILEEEYIKKLKKEGNIK